MNSRRSFFSRIAGMVAVVAIAPELAFRARLAFEEEVEKPVITHWFQNVRHSHCYDEEYLRAVGVTYRSNQPFQIPAENYEHAST